MHARSAENEVWMQMTGWPPSKSGCWLRMDGAVPLGIQGLIPDEPAYISILGYLQTTGFADASRTSLAGTLDLEVAASLLQGQLFKYIDISESQLASGTVPVQIGLNDRRITRVSMAGTDMLAAIREVKGTVTGQSVAALKYSTYTVSYPSEQLPTDISTPPLDLVMDVDGPDCH